MIRIAAATFVTGAGEAPAGAGGARGLTFAPPSPNPARDGVRFGFDLVSDADDVRLEVFDVRGRAVRALAAGPRAAGRHRRLGRPRRGARACRPGSTSRGSAPRRRGRAARRAHAVSRAATLAILLATALFAAGMTRAVVQAPGRPSRSWCAAAGHARRLDAARRGRSAVAGGLERPRPVLGGGPTAGTPARWSFPGHGDGLQDHARRLGDGGKDARAARSPTARWSRAPTRRSRSPWPPGAIRPATRRGRPP